MTNWKTQWNRICRYEERLDEMQRQVLFNRPAIYFCDDLFAFFIECHSFKDWLINDDDVLKELGWEKKEELIEDFVHSTYELQLCADIANGKKHRRIDRRIKSGPKKGDWKPRRTEVKELQESVTPGLVLSVEVVLHNPHEIIYDCCPTRKAREANRERISQARHELSTDEFRDLFESILDEIREDDHASWQAAAFNADRVRQNLTDNEFPADKIFLNVVGDVAREKLVRFDREDPPSFAFDSVADLASACTSEWIEFLDERLPEWRGWASIR